MSVREKAEAKLMELTDEDEVSYFMARGPIDTVGSAWLYEELIRSIDWNRVVLEAVGRHLTLNHEGSDELNYLCAECIEAVLLTYDTFPDWSK